MHSSGGVFYFLTVETFSNCMTWHSGLYGDFTVKIAVFLLFDP